MYVYVTYIPTRIYLFKVNNLKTRTLFGICSKLAIAIWDNLPILLSYFAEVYLRPSQIPIIETKSSIIYVWECPIYASL